MKTRNKIILSTTTIIAVIMSMLMPVSAAQIGSSNSAIYTANNTISQIQYVEVQPNDRYGYGYTDGPYDVVMQTPTSFFLSETATGAYTKYAPISTQVNSAGPIINDRVLMTTTGSPGGSMRFVTTKFYNHNSTNTINANLYPNPAMKAMVLTIDDAYILKGERKSLDANINNPNTMTVLLPYLSMIFAGQYTETFNIKVSYTVEIYADGQIYNKRNTYNYEEMVTGDYYLDINLGKQISTYNWDVSYTFKDDETISHYKDITIEITQPEGYDIGFVGLEINYQKFISGYSLKSEFEEDLKEIVNYKYIDNTADINFSEWITNSIGSFLDFEIFPGLNMGAILGLTFGLGILMMILRFFAGG